MCYKVKMSGAEYVGKWLRLTTDEGVYEGLCNVVDPVSRRITLVQGLFPKDQPFYV